jgi:hypothetical protein
LEDYRRAQAEQKNRPRLGYEQRQVPHHLRTVGHRYEPDDRSLEIRPPGRGSARAMTTGRVVQRVATDLDVAPPDPSRAAVSAAILARRSLNHRST